ncbi:MAG: carbonic anhydrase family protein [Chloroflexota bacterium]|nr:carbonic anhydrase family protein [Chloroflexota bacterium]
MNDMPPLVRLIVVSSLLLGAACAAPAATPAHPTAAPAVHWSYEGEEGPEHWGELDADFELCTNGRQQSPIDIGETDPQDRSEVVFDYRSAPLEIFNNGHTVQVAYPAGSSIQLDGTRYELLQFHFHAPSEHRVDGQAAEAELHLVHGSQSGALAVVGVLLMTGDHHDGIEPVIQALPAEPGPRRPVPGTEVSAAALLPRTRTTYRYPGSLTTPPCSEGVRWLLMTEPLGLSEAQLAALRGVLEGNNRPLQPLNDRVVEE